MTATKRNMATGKKQLNLFLDTEVLERQQYDFANSHFSQLVGLVRAGKVKVLSTKVTDREILTHITERAREAHKRVAGLWRSTPALRHLKLRPFSLLSKLPPPEKIEAELREQYVKFRRACKAVVLPIARIRPDWVFDQYFAQEPPFGPGKKKDQFPDAFAAMALRQWCIDHNNQKVYVVSGDNDWKEICGANRDLIYKPHLASFLALTPDPNLAGKIKEGLIAQSEALKRLLIAEFESLGFVLTDVDGLVEAVDVREIDIGEIYVVEASGGTARADVECTISYQAEVSYEDPSTGIYDSEEKRLLFAETKYAELDDEAIDTSEVQMYYDEKDPAQIKVKSVHFSQCDFEVSGWSLEEQLY